MILHELFFSKCNVFELTTLYTNCSTFGMYSIRYSKQHIRALQMRPLPKKKTDEVEVARARNEHPPRSQVLTQLQGIHTCTAAEGKSARAIITHTHTFQFSGGRPAHLFVFSIIIFLEVVAAAQPCPRLQRFFCSDKVRKDGPCPRKQRLPASCVDVF